METKRKLRIAAKLGNRSVNGAAAVAISNYINECEKSDPEEFVKKVKKHTPNAV